MSDRGWLPPINDGSGVIGSAVAAKCYRQVRRQKRESGKYEKAINDGERSSDD